VRHRFAAAAAALLLAVPALPALAQMDPAAAAAARKPLSPAERDAALDAIAAALPKFYVFPDKVPAILAGFAQARQAGRYATDDPALLAERVTEDLRRASGDRHLYLNYDPARYAAALNSKSGAGPDQGEDSAALERRAALRDNHGLTEQRILPGNVRYLRIAEFQWVRDETGAAYDAAMRFLKEGDAAIIDIRGNPGGSHGAVRYLVSHFMDDDVLELTFLARGEAPEQSHTLDHLPAGRLKGRPLYVLIDSNVGSAAEAFAYDVQQFKLGELVGAKTAGAANNNDFHPIAPGFMLSVPFGRPEHAVSHTNWEAVGVTPSVPAEPAKALETAWGLALARLAAAPGATPEARAEYAWAQVAVEARLHPVAVAPATLKALTGRYGDFTVRLQGGALELVRPDGRARRLYPLDANGLYGVENNDQLRVRFKPRAMETWWIDDPNPRVTAKG